ncbi:MAG: MotA/TolQ/ExbB proton channel family protein [Bacteroidetes bacterium]|nr:MotA/TolQ/ExbB proton channel family protein [Bacteroidota bacterium]MCW5895080.1 MotA/TolQ/ExbB proton channel family protein [Bacteroidota bacterium]
MNSRWDAGTILGLTLGFSVVFGSFVLEGGTIGGLILLPAMAIVFGGTIAAAMIGTSMSSIKSIGKLMFLAARPPKQDVRSTIDSIVFYSSVARREGLFALEKFIDTAPHQFLQKILRLTVDGIDPHSLRGLAETEIHYVGDRHARSAAIFHKMGGYSPTMGIIGTVMGLIATLAAAGEDPDTLIRHIATAFIATLWGVLMANIVWLPIYDKLKKIHDEESMHLDLILEGVQGIQAGEIPSVIKAKLESMLPHSERNSALA